MGLINGSQSIDEQEYDPNLQSFLTPYSPSFYLLDKENAKNKSLKKVIEESLKENIDDIKTKKEIKEKINMTSTEDKQNHKENNVINGSNSDNNKLMTINIINKIDNDHNSDKEEKKIIEENSDKINNNENNQDNTNQISNNENKNKNKDLKTAENSSDDDSQNEPLKYISSSLQKDIRNYYKFKDILGEGHFGSVRAAFKKREYSPHKFFAVKSISLKKLSEKQYQDLILEVKIISSLEHPHIVKFYETYHDDQYFHIVTELCRGNNLYMRLKKLKGKMKEEHAKIIIFKILHAINYCHSKGVVHRDLKPENIVFESPTNNSDINEYENNEENNENYFNIKICDFGLSALKKDTDKLHTILGTPYYMAPEVLKGDYNEKCDIWSIAAITYYLITGTEPFKGVTNNQIFSRILYTEPDYSPSKFWGTSAILIDFLKKCFIKDPMKRPTAREALLHPWFDNIFKRIHSTKFIGENIFYNISTTKKFSQLKRLIMRYVVYNMGHTELNVYKKAFLAFDKDNSGVITPDELKRVFKAYHKTLSETQIKNIMSVSDEKNDFLTYHEFIIVCLQGDEFLSPVKLLDAFLFFDVDNNNEINSIDLYLALLRWGKDIIDKNSIEKIIFLGTKKKYNTLDLKAFVEIFEDEINVEDYMKSIEEIKSKSNIIK
jgi:calcium-dependent protein kinase